MGHISLVNKSFCLQNICEQNYHKLLYLIPHIKKLDCSDQGIAQGKPRLDVRILEQTSYTKTLQLSYLFSGEDVEILEPAVKIRMYFDVQIAEVLCDYKRHEAVYEVNQKDRDAILEYKWQLNYFLEKWLAHCLMNNYRFMKKGHDFKKQGK